LRNLADALLALDAVGPWSVFIVATLKIQLSVRSRWFREGTFEVRAQSKLVETS